ncbi:MAG: glycosyltransferase family 2 protein [Clostridia bacterium]|nr:glycosyltransferase family 2 protein [Clostridia bacterium]
MKKIILVIPAYNEEENILKTINNINKNSDRIDYIVINDGSTDNTENILEKNNINHIKLVNNLGIGGAVQTGYKYALKNNYDIAIQFDGDGQHDISYVNKICEPIINGQADMVIGTRYLDKRESSFQSTFMRRLGSNIISFFIKLLCRKKITDPTSGFRAVNKKVIEEFANDYPTEYPEPESTVSLLVGGYKIEEVPVSMNPREGGKSSIRLGKTIDYMIKVVLAIIIDSISFKKKRRKK